MERITINTSVQAPIDLVWKSYNQGEHIVHWNFASDDWCCPSAVIDFREGGKYLARMEAKDGSFGFDFELTYNEIVNHDKVSYTMSDGRKAEVQFVENDDSTLVSVSFEPEMQNPLDMQEQGWQAILNSFKHYVESIKQ